MTINLKHRSIRASALTLVALTAASFVRPLPWPLWAVWAALTAVALWRASRG